MPEHGHAAGLGPLTTWALTQQRRSLIVWADVAGLLRLALLAVVAATAGAHAYDRRDLMV